eukprot:gene10333-biopygen21305
MYRCPGACAELSFVFGRRREGGRRKARRRASRDDRGEQSCPGNSDLRTAIRTAARARSGRANDTDGLWE